MTVEMLKGKIHRATVKQAELDYVGSITVDEDLNFDIEIVGCPIVREVIEAEPLARIDYVSIVDARFMQPVERVEKDVLVAMAVYIGKTRLIDNFSYEV